MLIVVFAVIVRSVAACVSHVDVGRFEGSTSRQLGGVLPILQPRSQLVVVVGVPVPLHTTRLSAWHSVALGVQALQLAGVPPAPQPYAHVIGEVPLPSAAHVESVEPGVAALHIVAFGTQVLQREIVLPVFVPQPFAHVVIVSALPSAMHVDSTAPVQLVAFGVHVLQRAVVLPVLVPQPLVQAVGVAALPSAAHVESVFAPEHVTAEGTHALQRIAAMLQPAAPHDIAVMPVPAELHVCAVVASEHVMKAPAVQ